MAEPHGGKSAVCDPGGCGGGEKVRSLEPGKQLVGALALDIGDKIFNKDIGVILAEKETKLSETIFNGLKKMPKVTLYRENYDSQNFAPLVSFNVENLHSEQVSAYLNEHGIAVRGGFHCSPLAHISNGTQRQGAVRISPSIFNKEKDINFLLNLLRKIAI